MKEIFRIGRGGNGADKDEANGKDMGRKKELRWRGRENERKIEADGREKMEWMKALEG